MSLTLQATLTDRGMLGGVPGKGLDARLQAFLAGVEEAAVAAAQSATSHSRANVRRVRDRAPARNNRYHGLRQAITWHSTPDGVVLDLGELNTRFPPWIIQEVGTGERAIQRSAGTPNPRGRPAAGNKYVKTVKSQVGRKIKPSLVFATRSGVYSPPGAARGQQLYLRSQIRGAPVRFDPIAKRSVPGITIGKEITGQHFIQRGGEKGFQQYRESVLLVARQQLRKRVIA